MASVDAEALETQVLEETSPLVDPNPILTHWKRAEQDLLSSPPLAREKRLTKKQRRWGRRSEGRRDDQKQIEADRRMALELFGQPEDDAAPVVPPAKGRFGNLGMAPMSSRGPGPPLRHRKPPRQPHARNPHCRHRTQQRRPSPKPRRPSPLSPPRRKQTHARKPPSCHCRPPRRRSQPHAQKPQRLHRRQRRRPSPKPPHPNQLSQPRRKQPHARKPQCCHRRQPPQARRPSRPRRVKHARAPLCS